MLPGLLPIQLQFVLSLLQQTVRIGLKPPVLDIFPKACHKKLPSTHAGSFTACCAGRSQRLLRAALRTR